MASEVSFIHLHDPEDDVDHQTPSSLLYWSHDFHFSSDPDFPLQDDDVSLIFNGPDLFDRRENQVNIVIDLFHQRVDQSQVLSDSNPTNIIIRTNISYDDEINAVDLFSDALTESGFGAIEGNHYLDLGLELGFDSMDGNEIEIRGGDDDDGDDFFVERRVSGLSASEATSNFNCFERFGNGIRRTGFNSDSEDEIDNRILTTELNSGDEYGIDDHVNECYDVDDDDVSVSISLRWDSLQLEDHRETLEDFEWEEVDGRVDEREVLSGLADAGDDDEISVSLSISPVIAPGYAVNFERAVGMGTLGWEVLFNTNNLETNQDMDENDEPFFADREDYIYNGEYEMLFGQLAENENAFIGRPPASKSVVENLPSSVATQEDLMNNNALCAICKDEINLGETMKQLPCAHRYHGDCITPWLGIRNTCPVCRHELPTDDAEYERRRSQRAGAAP
ncbi:RNF181 protein [Hibiscus syriacus]|uniref:RING-type E3 ubiquitin transferase n=1 Tax=Hibiscus syriacus TaxID=106335 RepID=A0A6A2XAW5_HIBSY|nr:uncharacterized protein LOC120172192 [Hibiscus syriacus]KAE8672318.1 RNF181 protein [Hibiscus syriacus]